MATQSLPQSSISTNWIDLLSVMTFSGFSLPVSVSQADILPPSTVYKTRFFASNASSSTALGIWYCRTSFSSIRSHIFINLSRPEVKRNSSEATIEMMDFWCPTRACVHFSPTVLSFSSGEWDGRNLPVADFSTLTWNQKLTQPGKVTKKCWAKRSNKRGNSDFWPKLRFALFSLSSATGQIIGKIYCES